MVDEDPNLSEVLRQLPTIEPRPGFVDRAFKNATASGRSAPFWNSLVRHPHTWVGVAAGVVLALAISLSIGSFHGRSPAREPITLAVNEIRQIEVLIDSER